MYKKIFLLIAVVCMASANAQSKEEVLAQGWLLYHSERASWLGTDIFMAKFPEKRDKIGGYLSYTDAKTKTHKCIFFDRQEDPQVLGTISFDDSFVVEAADINTDDRKLTPEEKELYTIRQNALDEITANGDGLFKMYDNTNYNLIPQVVNGKKMVYVLTGPTNNGVVIFGNDYLITFDKKNKVKSKKKLHNNIMPVEFKDGFIQVSGMHSHNEETGELITATDICTLLLYGPYTGWDTYTVISKNKVSLWNCKKEELLVMTKEAWEKIAGLQQGKEKEDKKEKQ
jgi:hypothetical protein